MKILKLIVHRSCQQELSDKLKASGYADDFTFTHVEGHGSHNESDLALSTEELVVGYIPRISVEILFEEKNLQGLLDTVRAIKGVKSHGLYWIVIAESCGEL